MVIYRGRSDIKPERSRPRAGVISRRAWFVEFWLRGRYVGLAR